MAKTIAIFGAGPGLGRSVAQRFGREGFAVALVALRSPGCHTCRELQPSSDRASRPLRRYSYTDKEMS